ncbi:MAG: hypothetical protein K9M44_02820 [Candidatus Pacebacteria bacterium]|nr:hypothetical protein [Candidatus Paceibacterota bacterium]
MEKILMIYHENSGDELRAFKVLIDHTQKRHSNQDAIIEWVPWSKRKEKIKESGENIKKVIYLGLASHYSFYMLKNLASSLNSGKEIFINNIRGKKTKRNLTLLA